MKKSVFILFLLGCSNSSITKKNNPAVLAPDFITENEKSNVKIRKNINFIKKLESMEVASVDDLTSSALKLGITKTQAFGFILDAMDSKDESKVEKSLKIINKMGDYKLDLLIENLEKGNRNWRVISILGNMGSHARKALPVLRKVWHEGNTEVKIAVLNAVSKISSFEGAELAFLSASSEDIDVALMGISAMEEKNISDSTIMNYARILRFGDSYQRCSIMILFGNSIKNVKKHHHYKLIREHIYPWLLFFKKSKDITLRSTAQMALSQSGF